MDFHVLIFRENFLVRYLLVCHENRLVQNLLNRRTNGGMFRDSIRNQICRRVDAAFHLIDSSFEVGGRHCADIERVRDVCHFAFCPAVLRELSVPTDEFVVEVICRAQVFFDVPSRNPLELIGIHDGHDVVEHISDGAVFCLQFVNESGFRLFDEFGGVCRCGEFRFNTYRFAAALNNKSVKRVAAFGEGVHFDFDVPSVSHLFENVHEFACNRGFALV